MYLPTEKKWVWLREPTGEKWKGFRKNPKTVTEGTVKGESWNTNTKWLEIFEQIYHKNILQKILYHEQEWLERV